MFKINTIRKKSKLSDAFLKHGRVSYGFDGVCFKIRKNRYSVFGNSIKSTFLRRLIKSNKLLLLVIKSTNTKGYALSILRVLPRKYGLIIKSRNVQFVSRSTIQKISRKYQIRKKYLKYFKDGRFPMKYSRKKLFKQVSLQKVLTKNKIKKCMVKLIKININSVDPSEVFCLNTQFDGQTLFKGNMKKEPFNFSLHNNDKEIYEPYQEFACAFCSNTFPDDGRLKYHYDFCCEKTKDKLKSRINSNSNKHSFRYYCPQFGCQKYYLNISAAKSHARKQHSNNGVNTLPIYFVHTKGLFKCRLCFNEFKSINLLRTHHLQCDSELTC